jgi:hypothetical protein
MDNPNINEGNPNILSGNEAGADLHDQPEQNKENVDVLKNEQLHDSEKSQQNQEFDDTLQRPDQPNQIDEGEYLKFHLMFLYHQRITLIQVPCLKCALSKIVYDLSMIVESPCAVISYVSRYRSYE